MTEKERIFAKLMGAHDSLYNAIEFLGNIKVSGEGALILGDLLDELDKTNLLMESVMESDWWKSKGA